VEALDDVIAADAGEEASAEGGETEDADVQLFAFADEGAGGVGGCVAVFEGLDYD